MVLGHDGKTGKAQIRSWYAPVALFVAAAVIYSLNLERALHADELYHILAARGILEFGEPRIADGLYSRVYWFTWMLSRVFAVFGESLAVARVPSVLAMSCLVTLLFVWLRHNAGSVAAIIGSLLFAVSPFAVDIALFTRFYSLQALFFFCGAALVFLSIEGRRERRYLYILFASLFLLVAVYLQPTTLVGVSGLGLWVVFRLGVSWVRVGGSTRNIGLMALLVGALIACALAVWLGIFPRIWEMYRAVPLFNKPKENQFWFYYIVYLKNYPTLWPAMIFLAIAAVAYRPKPAWFAVVLFGVSILISSFAASKNLRYMVYAQPFFFIVVGIGLASIGPSLWKWLKSLRDTLVHSLELPVGPTRIGLNLILTFAAVALIVGNPGFGRTIAILGNYSKSAPNWNVVRREVEPWFDKVDIIVTQAELEMLYYYGDYDLLFSPSRLGENVGSVDFDPDYRTGKPMVGSLVGMKTIFECYQRGIFVTTKGRWRNGPYISASVSDFVTANTKPLNLPRHSNVLAFVWDQKVSERDCGELPQFRVPTVKTEG